MAGEPLDPVQSLILPASLVAASGDAIISTDAEDRITSWNPAAERLFGHPAGEVMGQPFSLLIPHDAVAELQRFRRRVIAQGEPLTQETSLRRRDGTLVAVEGTVSALPGMRAEDVRGYVMILRDISERKQHDQRLRELEMRFRTFFEELPGLAYIYSARDPGADPFVLHRSHQFEVLTGYPNALWQHDQDFLDTIVHPDDREWLNAYDNLVDETGEPFRATYRLVTRDGRIVWVREEGNLVRDAAGERLYWVGVATDVTDQKRAEEELAASEERFRTVFADASIGMGIVSPTGEILRANHALCAFLGYPEAELIARSISSLTDPADLAPERAAAEPWRQSGVTRFEREQRYIRRDGRPVWGHLHGSGVADETGGWRYFIVQIEDITVRKAAEAERAATQQNLGDVLERITDGFFALDRQGRLTYINAAAGRLLRRDRATYLGLNFWQEFPMIQGTPVAEGIEQAMATMEVTSFDYYHPPIDAWFESRVYPSAEGVAIFFRDVTERRRLAAATAEALARLQQSNQELQRLSAAKSDFVSMISHEFRTPLTSIQGYSELIMAEAESLDDARQFAQTINQGAMRLAQMVNDVLDLDRLESGQHDVQLGPVNLNRVVSDVLVDLRPTTANHQLIPDLDPSLPIIQADYNGLFRVVTNLLGNAIKYSPAGGPITVTTRGRPEAVELMVADKGMGVPEAHRQSIFARYGRISRPEQAGIAGTGLGLPTARGLVELHGGRIWVEDNVPSGSVFHVLLPMAAASG